MSHTLDLTATGTFVKQALVIGAPAQHGQEKGCLTAGASVQRLRRWLSVCAAARCPVYIGSEAGHSGLAALCPQGCQVDSHAAGRH